jgi:very-long-chain (3R)-3-hydroxyacyl-CoA dehydratase
MSENKPGTKNIKLSNYYIKFYNSFQFLGWCLITYNIIISKNYKNGFILLKFFLSLALLEIVHSFLNLGGNLIPTIFQNLGRNFVIFVINGNNNLFESKSARILFLAWASGELVRYPFYLFKDNSPNILFWLRYHLFFVLYPIGFFCELLCLYYGLDKLKSIFELRIPFFDFVFDFKCFGYIVMFGYLFFIPYLFFNMVKQRNKKFSKKKSN